MSIIFRSLQGFRRMASSVMTSPDSFKKRIVWMDLEMTGLNVEVDQILEAACVITDGDLNIVAKMHPLVIHHSNEVLDGMNEWCIKQHGLSGLTEESRKSNLTLQEAEKKLISFVKEHALANNCPLAGNSVHYDKRFIERYLPKLDNYLHYRIIDVSTVKELCMRWYPNEYAEISRKKNAHRAFDDIIESIEELKAYRKLIFKAPNPEMHHSDISG